MRDLDRWKDKVEISLDGRQIFFLFFGSAVAACLIFVVGVLIGKRIEARALALQPAAIEDPLAALDQLGDADEADEGLTFHKALTPPKAALPAARPQVVQQAPTKKPDATASHFTLQLSAFPDKADAEEFMHKIQSAGYKPFLVASEIPGKGVFFRVRVGDYGSRQAAVDAKSEFERKQRIIAYVAKL